MDQLNMDLTKVDEAANQIGGQVAGDVLNAFCSAPAMAQAAAGMNAGHMTSMAMVAMFAQIFTAVKQLNEHTTEHADLLRQTAQIMRDRDTSLATNTFSAQTIFTEGR